MAMQLVDGDYIPDGHSGFKTVFGIEEILDRVLFRLTVRRGSFPFLPDLGSRLHLLGREKASARLNAAKQFVLEALADETCLELNSVHLSDLDNGKLILTVGFTYDAQQFALTTEI